MKKISILLIGIGLIYQSCNKQIELKPGIENFDISLEKKTYKVGEEVNFYLHGDPDMIVFYSGEVLHQYAYKDGRKLTLDNLNLSFTTSKPVTLRRQDNQLFIMASTDFNGDYSNFSNIEEATWTDITDRFTLSESITFSPSGEVDISDLIVEDRPLYIGFRYVSYPHDQGRVGNWHVQNFSLVGRTVLGPMTLGDMKESGFMLVDQHPDLAPSKSKLTATRITLYGDLDIDMLTESWAVSKGFETGETDLGFDLPVAIKGMESAPLNRYTYIYNEPGTYKATFVASNASVDEHKSIVREIEFTIIE